MEYFVLWFRLSFSERYTVWCSNDDGPDYVLSKGRVVPCFTSKARVEAFAKENGIELQREKPIRHNLNRVQLWLHSKKGRLNCNDFLAAWNLFTDVEASFPDEAARLEKKTSDYIREYNKLFYGNNLKAVRGRHPKYFPAWSSEELEHISEILHMGLFLLRKRFRYYA